MMTPGHAAETGSVSLNNTEVNGIGRAMHHNTFDDLVRRIDEFLGTDGSAAAGEDGEVRRGTREKVRESVGVIRKALKDYTYVSLVQLLLRIRCS